MYIDKIIFLFLNGLTGKYFFLDFLFYFFAQISIYFLVFFFLFLLLRNWKKNGWFVGEAIFAGLFARLGLVEIIRYISPQLRPFKILEGVNLLVPAKESLSFPSGHTSFVFALSTIVYFYNKKIGIVFYAISFLMGISRIIVGIHWPTDIFVGILVGILSGIIVNEVFFLVKNKLIKKKSNDK
jgi:undecaprenyl-diphosphatase